MPEPAGNQSNLPSTLLLAAADTPSLAEQLDRWIARPPGSAAGDPGQPRPAGEGPARLAIVDVTTRRLELARKVVAQDLPWRGRSSVWFEPRGLLQDGGQLAFLFPGVEPDFEPRVDDVARLLGLEGLLPPSRAAARPGMPALERQARGIITVGRLLHQALDRLGIVPDMVAGHSVGEWTASLSVGVVPGELVDQFIDELRPGAVEVADVVYLTLGCGATTAAELITDLPHTVISHDNCPQQSVVCGLPDEVGVVADRCRARHILCQELPFRSGFHSPLFAPHLPAYRTVLDSLPLQAPSVPLWSATTCRPYPQDPGEVRTLLQQHLLEPVRFRELALATYEAGARAFVQLGVGSLPGFIDDTLGDRDGVAIAANTPKRTGLEQLCQVAAALWVEGRDVAFHGLGGERRGGSGRDVSGAARKVDVGGELVTERRFALDVEPAWADHALLHQPEHWPHFEDRFPLVPMAGIVEVLIEVAAELHPGWVPVRVEDIAAVRYLVVDPPTTVRVRAVTCGVDPDGSPRVKVSIDRHAWATVTMAPSYPEAPPAEDALRLSGERPNPIAADRLYADRHMFHGPAYQGVDEIVTLAENGERALLRTPDGPGGLLDSAGQLMGHWLAAKTDYGRLILPTSIDRIELFGPHPPSGAVVDCTVAVTELTDQVLRADMMLVAGEETWCRVTGWEDRRFTTDARVFESLLWPERTAVSLERDGYVLTWERWLDSATRDIVMRRYLGRDERRSYEQRNPLVQRELLLGRIAVKDAVRQWLWARDHGSLFPAELVVANDHFGRPVVRGPYAPDLRVSLAHIEGLAVATVAEGRDVGVDLERIEARHSDFESLALTFRERALVPPDGYDRDAWLTSLWAVKEAAAKATGRGLQGRPRDFEVTEPQVDRDRCRCRVGDRSIAFERLDGAPGSSLGKEYVVAWTTDR